MSRTIARASCPPARGTPILRSSMSAASGRPVTAGDGWHASAAASLLAGALALGVALRLAPALVRRAALAQAQPRRGRTFTLGVALGLSSPNGWCSGPAWRPSPSAPGGRMPPDAYPGRVGGGDRSSHELRWSSGALADRDVPAWAHAVRVEGFRSSSSQPGRRLWYRFRTGGEVSANRPHADGAGPRGRRRSPPVRLRLLPAIRARATSSRTATWLEDDLDLIIHVGDYIYRILVGPRPRP